MGGMFMFTEGYGTNDEHITGVNGLGRHPLSNGAIYFESCHWSVTFRFNADYIATFLLLAQLCAGPSCSS